jgi:hypothetical protein
MDCKQMTRKIQAVVALVALLIASVPALAESLATPDLPSCCNTVYCPLHHRQARELQQDKTKCDSKGNPARNDCSMRACDPTPQPAMGTALYLLATPPAIRYAVTAEPARFPMTRHFAFAVSIPLTPPPRLLAS